MIDLNHDYGFLKLTGPDAAKFLQGQCSANIETLADGHCVYGVICDPKGRIQALFHAFRQSGDYYLRMPKDVLNHALAHLKKYSIFSKVTIEIDENRLFFYASNKEKAEHIACEFAIYDTGFTGFYRHKALETHETTLAFKEALIEHGIPEVNLACVDQFTPHNLNLQCLGALDFNKGCYTGQEIVTRMHFRGTLKQHLYIGTLTEALELTPMMAVHDSEDKPVGQVVNALRHGDKTLCLVTLKDSAREHALIEGLPVTLRTPDYLEIQP